MRRSDFIGKGRGCLIPAFNANLEGRDAAQDSYQSARKKYLYQWHIAIHDPLLL
ncbi:hypothetical protein RCH20_000989 [Psychrobacter sp. PL15]|nr:hypothetical protein [Psychrobacter sp. PL15]